MSLIGVFDSGVGGLTVLKRLSESFPSHDFIYLADTARLPYGSKSKATIQSYLKNCVAFLKDHEVDFVIVACNSASTVLIQSDLKFGLPVYNVLEPGAEAALSASENSKIGVLGTRATILSEAYKHTLLQMNPNAHVYQAAAPLLVPLVEEGWVDDPLTNMIVYRYTKPLLDQGIDTLILGCTHYPVLKKAFEKVVGHSVKLVDSPDALIKNLHQSLNQGSNKQGLIRIFCTDLTPHLEKLIAQLITPLSSLPVQKVDL